MDPYTNDDSTSNQSDSSSSSTNIMSRQQQLLHGNPSSSGPVRSQIEQESSGTPKRTLMTKNAGTSEKRKRNISASSVPRIKREPQVDLNDEVRCFLLFPNRENIHLGRYKNSKLTTSSSNNGKSSSTMLWTRLSL